MKSNPTMKSADVRLRLEPELKEQAVKVLAESGLEISIAIRLFLRQVVAQGGLPFEIRPNATTIRAMKETRTVQGPFSTAQELFDALDKGAARKTGRASAKKQVHKGVRKGLAQAPRQRSQSRIPQGRNGPAGRE